MSEPALRPEPTHAAPVWLPRVFALICVAFSILTMARWDAFRHLTFFNRWPLFDWQDIHVYFESSRWVTGAGTLYRQVPSEYPLLPNLLFGAVRAISNAVAFLPAAYDRFAWSWVSMALPLYFFVLHRLIDRYPRPAALLWLTPAALHFSLYRYDIFAVIATLFTVEAIRQDRVRRAALLLGIVTALKGYSLFLLPALAVYAWRRRGFREAVTVSVINLAPFLIGNLVTLGFGGVEGLLYAYRFHAQRWLNGESTFDAIAYLTGPAIRDFLAGARRLPLIIQVSAALIAAAFRPRTPEQLMRAFLFATTAFVSFSVFYSPQFVLWLVPFVAEWTWPLASWLVVALSWTTYAYFPVAYFRRAHFPRAFEMSVTVVAALRVVLLGIAGAGRPPAPRDAPGAGRA